jgi:3-oxoacyl-[acyl-carrier-protein] synthase I
MTYITSAGMVCAVGLSAEASCAAIRAGIAGFRQTKHLDQEQYYVVGAPVPGLPIDRRGTDRLIGMLAASIEDCLRNREVTDSAKIPLLVCLAEIGRPGIAPDAGAVVLAGVQDTLGRTFHPRLSTTICNGHTSAFDALKLARMCMQTGDAPGCIVAGVDSYLNSESLTWLGAHARLKTPTNSDGVIPGEAAAAIFASLEPTQPGSLEPCVIGLGFATEAASVLTEDPMIGLGLTSAARSALSEAEMEMHQVDFRIADVTGESYGFKEQALVVGRLLRTPKKNFPLWDIAGSIGDVGAAAGVCQLVIAHYAFRKNYAAGERVICCTSAVPGQRAVALIQGSAAGVGG